MPATAVADRAYQAPPGRTGIGDARFVILQTSEPAAYRSPRLYGGDELRQSPPARSTSPAQCGGRKCAAYSSAGRGVDQEALAVVRLRSFGIMPSSTSLSLNFRRTHNPSVRGRVVKVFRLSDRSR